MLPQIGAWIYLLYLTLALALPVSDLDHGNGTAVDAFGIEGITEREAVAMYHPPAGGSSGQGSGSGKGKGKYVPIAPAPLPGSGSSQTPGARMLPAAQVEQTIVFAQKGAQMREWMFMSLQELRNSPGAPEEAKVTKGDIQRSGWRLVDESDPSNSLSPQDIQAYADLLNDLAGVVYGGGAKQRAFAAKDAIDITPTTMKRISWFQDQSYMIAGQSQTPTNAYYTNLYVPASRLIVVEHALSPQCSLLFGAALQGAGPCQPRNPNFMPPVQHWSDLTYVQYMTMFNVWEISEVQNMSPPSWIMVRKFAAPLDILGSAASMISYCVATYSGQSRISPWPGTSFAVGTYCFNAIMGTHIGQAIGMMLVTHAERNNARRDKELTFAVDSITVLLMPGDDDNEEKVQNPSLLFHIGSVNSQARGAVDLQKIYDDNKEAGLEAPGSGIGSTPPHTVTPARYEDNKSLKKSKGESSGTGGKGRKRPPPSGNSPGQRPQGQSSRHGHKL